MSTVSQEGKRASLFKDSGFRWVFAGGLISMLGDQFTLIALPWLVLKMTGDTLMLGAVLAVISVPRALFILIGGAMVDRHSPKQVLMLTKYVNVLLLGGLAILVFMNALTLWMVFALAAGIGLAAAFSIPSGTSLMPHVVPRDQLQTANSAMMVVRQATMFAGPLLAGLVIALFGDGGDGLQQGAKGLGGAFLFDAFSFALSAWTLSKVVVKPLGHNAPAASGQKRASVWFSVKEGLRWCWNDRELRVCFVYWAAVMFFVSGPIQVAMPVVAGQLGDSATAFGILMGTHGAGTLMGMLVSGAKPRFRVGGLGSTMLLIDGIVGSMFVLMGGIDAVWQGSVLLMIIGLLTGFIQVVVYTWFQTRIAPEMLGRVMSVFMFIMVGVSPISAAICGWLMRSIEPFVLFASSGAMLVAIVLVAYAGSSIRAIPDMAVESE